MPTETDTIEKKVVVARYTEAVGRRKTSVARARFTPAEKNSVMINDRELAKYFGTKDLQDSAMESFNKSKPAGNFAITIKVLGGGIHSQSEAIRHAIARVLIKLDPESRKKLKKTGFLKRDPRAKERRKFGLKKARKAPQWAKR
jgi:small subunit ribosomal protein S9